ncbi:hypothetical protein MU0083_002592 [[Mycobacterium] kokjensenii]|uniref:Uncharacterized protein n=1 Tax=[Mycobacterium] kokjensenii TaxID=3064287 RepID=A0ABN9N637_9MYCO|nr:hypothetical protein [Mycolicibacter sp. MU0083]CAJ1501081.1 hypothetical protein MU0083_002592 [Mycolicibacter sp. MU0083]
MARFDWVRQVVPAVVAVAALAIVGTVLNRKRTLADLTVAQIEDSITALDPVTRAAVVARLGADTAEQVKSRLHD